jgi:hypothetical protein
MTDVFAALKSELSKALGELSSITGSIQERAGVVRRAASRLDMEYFEQMRAMSRFIESLRNSSATKLAQYHENLVAKADRLISLSHKAKTFAHLLTENWDLNDLTSVPGLVSEMQTLRVQIDDTTKSIPVFDLQNEFLPAFASATFIVQKLRDAIDTESSSSCVYTPSQEIYGCLWRLKICPCGTIVGRSTHVSIFVELIKGTGIRIPYGYRIEIMASNPREKTIAREFRSEFTVNDSWGWNKAILIEKVTGDGFLNDEGNLTIVLSLRPETYHQACRELQVAFTEEKAKYQGLKLQVTPRE